VTDRAIESLRERALASLSVFAREVLGHDYYKVFAPDSPDHGKEIRVIDWDGELRPCGVVDWGPHGDMVRFMEGLTDAGMMVCSRGAMKTTIGMSWILWQIIKNPDVRIIVHMATLAEAKLTVRALRDTFVENEKLREVFGDFAGGQGTRKGWTGDAFTVAKRTRSDRNPTVVASGTDKNTVGKRADIIWIDDPVRPQDRQSIVMLEKAKDSFRAVNKLLDPGGVMLITLTPYDERDLCHLIRSSLQNEYKILELPCGMEAVGDDDGGYKLIGEPRYPHHTREVLERKLREDGTEGGPQWFNMSYALKITNPADQVFQREWFREARWESRFSRCNAYVLTDAAVSDDDAACFSVAALVILDSDDTAYIADMVIGHWKPPEFRDEVCDFIQNWAPKTRLLKIHMENVGMNAGLRVLVEEELHRRNIRLAWEQIPRRGGEGAKRARIRSLTGRVQAGRLVILDTCRKTYREAGQDKILWSTNGFYDVEKDRYLPDGELVRQFVDFRWTSKGKTGARVDIPDALADLDAVNEKEMRYCVPTRGYADASTAPPVPWNARPEAHGGKPVPVGPMSMLSGRRETPLQIALRRMRR